MAGLGDLIGGALGGARDAVERVLVKFEADTTALDSAINKLDQKIAHEEQQRASTFQKAQAALQKSLALEEDYSRKAQQLSAARAHAAEMAVMGVTKATDAEVAALQKEVMAKAQAVQKAQEHERALTQESQALSAHIGMLRADRTALEQRAAVQATKAPSGVSAAGAAVLGGLGAAGGLLALTAVASLARGIEDAATSYQRLGHEVDHTAKLMGTSAENASVMIYAFQRFGLTASDVSRTVVQLTRHITSNEEQFNALGISTRDANHHFLDSFQIFDHLRHVLSETADGTAKTAIQLELASRGGSAAGQSFAELNQILSLTDEQWKALEREARLNNAVMSESDALMGTKVVQSGRGLGQALEGLGRSFSRLTAGPLHDFLEGLNDILDTFSAFGAETQGMNIFEKIGAAFDFSQSGDDRFGRVRARVEQAKRDRAEIAALEGRGAGTEAEAGLKSQIAAANQKATNAIRDRIDAIKEEARTQEEALREELSNFEATKQREIDLIEERSRISQRANENEIRDIESEKRAAEDLFTTRQRQREDTITGLREQLSLMERQWREEDARAALADAESQLTRDKGTTVFRSKGMTEEAYQQAVAEHNKRVLADEKRVADEKKKIERDAQKAKLEEQIKAIEAIATLERRQLDDYKKARDEEIRLIRIQMQVQKDASDAAVKGVRDEIKAEKDRVEDKIKGIEKETAALVKELEKQIKALGDVAGGYVKLKDAADAAAEAQRAALAAWRELTAAHDAGERGHSTATGAAAVGPMGPLGPQSPVVNPDILSTWPQIPGFANGGDMLISDPTALVSMRTGRAYAKVAENGPEPASFGGGGGRGTTHVHLHVGSKEVAEVVVDEMGRAFSRRAAHGYGRKA